MNSHISYLLRGSIWTRALAIALISLAIVGQALALPIASPRSVTLGSSAPGATTNHDFSFTIPSTGNVGSIKFEYCTTASGTCTTPTGLVTTSATLASQSGTGATGFTVQNGTAGKPYISRTSASISAGTAVTYSLDNITNPATTNQTFYVRITTYSGTDGATGLRDSGVVAASTANQIVVSASVDETLSFCVYTAASCAGGGSTIDLGALSTTATASSTNKIDASTNATGGYVIRYYGSTLTSGANTVAALASPTASTTGTGQFGLNVRANTTPAVGSDVTGTGIGTGSSGYNTANQFKFASGDPIVQAASATNSNTYTVSYIANIAGAQAAGQYTTTLTYICTATF